MALPTQRTAETVRQNVWAPKPPEMPAAAAPTNGKAPEYTAPLAPAALEETGLTQAFIAGLALKLLYEKGQSTAQDLSDALCLPLTKIVQPPLDFLKSEHLIA